MGLYICILGKYSKILDFMSSEIKESPILLGAWESIPVHTVSYLGWETAFGRKTKPQWKSGQDLVPELTYKMHCHSILKSIYHYIPMLYHLFNLPTVCNQLCDVTVLLLGLKVSNKVILWVHFCFAWHERLSVWFTFGRDWCQCLLLYEIFHSLTKTTK